MIAMGLVCAVQSLDVTTPTFIVTNNNSCHGVSWYTAYSWLGQYNLICLYVVHDHSPLIVLQLGVMNLVTSMLVFSCKAVPVLSHVLHSQVGNVI